MEPQYDIVIRGGEVVDGSGREPFAADVAISEQIDNLYVLGETPNYFPAPEDSIGASARRLGLTAEEVAYDALLQNDGHAILYRPATNVPGGSDASVIEQMRDAGTVLGLGDGGAHYGVVCDLSLLSGWQTLNR